MAIEYVGPAFDTGTLIRPTQRKFVCCWMEMAGAKTLLLPKVWSQLTEGAGTSSQFRSSDAWVRLAKELHDTPAQPYQWVEWDTDLEDAAYDIRSHFTQACFPHCSAERIPQYDDAIIVSQALALGTDLLVTSDINTIDHYEINLLAEQRLGRNAGFVTTLDEAVQQAHRGCDAGQALLTFALTTIAPRQDVEWSVDAAHQDLMRLCEAMNGASLPITASRIGTRWEQCANLEATLRLAQMQASELKCLASERARVAWHREFNRSVTTSSGLRN